MICQSMMLKASRSSVYTWVARSRGSGAEEASMVRMCTWYLPFCMCTMEMCLPLNSLGLRWQCCLEGAASSKRYWSSPVRDRMPR